MKRYVALAIFLVTIIIGLIWAYGQSYMEVSVSSPDQNAEYSYVISSQSDSKYVVNVKNGPVTKQRVPSGNYQISVSSGDKFGIAVVKTGHFFGTTTKSLSISPELARTFVGKNPLYCMDYAQQTLLSYNCGDSINKVQVHEPGTNQNPSFVGKLNTPFSGYVTGSFVLGNETYQILRSPPNLGDSDVPGQSLVKINSGLGTDFVRALDGLSSSDSYSASKYGDGFIIYNRSFSQVNYYSSINAPPQQIDVSQDNDSLTPVALSANNGHIIAEYSNDIGDSPTNKSKGSKTKTILVISDGNSKQEYTLSNIFSTIAACGDNLLCGVGEPDNLYVYKIKGSKLVLQYQLNNAQLVADVGGKTIVVRDTDVLNLDANTGTATVDYRFVNYSYCGFATAPAGYLLCIRDSSNTTSNAILIGNDASSYNIDQVVSGLADKNDIKLVDAYKQYVYITPNLGSLVYDSTSKSFTYSTAVKDSVRNSLPKELEDAGLAKNGFIPVIFLL